LFIFVLRMQRRNRHRFIRILIPSCIHDLNRTLMKSLFLFAACALFTTASLAQVKVSTTASTPDPSAILEAESSSQGFLPPRLTTAQRDAISSPAEGLRIYNLDTKCENYFNGANWLELCGICNPPAPAMPGAINGTAAACPAASGQTYSIGSVANATSYTWNVPAGWSVTAGQGSTSVTVTTGNTGQNGLITVTAGNTCGTSSAQTLSVTVGNPAPGAPAAGTHTPSSADVVWNWNSTENATGYKWNTSDQYATATDLGNVTTVTQTGLACNTPQTIYVWAYNVCGNSVSVALTATTGACVAPIVATGGTVTQYVGNGTNGENGVTYKVHTFTATGNHSFNVTSAGSPGLVDVLVVAGGGGGASGAGGAGGVLYTASYAISNQNYTVTVGAGGARGGPGVCCSVRGENGQNSVFGPLVAVGGGGGGQWNLDVRNGKDGGSGGGAGAGDNGGSGGIGTAGQGNNGGANTMGSPSYPYPTGGGGGAGGVGGNNVNNTKAGDGGPGVLNHISGTGTYYGGGGGGGINNGFTAGVGGIGGGGNGCSGEPCTAQNGAANTGGGGGGANGSGGGFGGNGGSGIVIVRYPL
jgi:hypothetical protein